jgi:hypothetical protein
LSSSYGVNFTTPPLVVNAIGPLLLLGHSARKSDSQASAL